RAIRVARLWTGDSAMKARVLAAGICPPLVHRELAFFRRVERETQATSPGRRRAIGERRDAVLRTAIARHDAEGGWVLRPTDGSGRRRPGWAGSPREAAGYAG